MATLYLTEPRSLVKKEGDTLLVEIPPNQDKGTDKRKVRVPLIKVTQVVAFGDVTLTSPALAALLAQQADVCFCTAWGRFQGRLAPELNKNCLIRLAQHRAHHDPPRACTLARAFVRGKLANMRAMLMRANRKRSDSEVEQAIDSLKTTLDQLDALDPQTAAPPPDPAHPQADTLYGTLHGLEGAGSAAYFGVLGRLLSADWPFEKRQRRPPRDPVNALLSYGYVLLMNQVSTAISIVGLDPYVGFLHASQYGKPALALDVMEPFRPLVVDSTVLTLLNNGMLAAKDFVEELGAYRLTDDGRRTFLTQFEARLDAEIQHPIFGYQATYRRCLELEVRLVAKWLSGEISVYKPFVVR